MNRTLPGVKKQKQNRICGIFREELKAGRAVGAAACAIVERAIRAVPAPKESGFRRGNRGNTGA